MGLIRLLIIVGIGYIAYRLAKGLFGPGQHVEDKKTGQVIDEMVQDPFCKTYIPARQAHSKVLGGKRYFFCSQECAEKFREQMKKES